MELLIFIGALALMGVLAMHVGHDSRPTAESKEEALAGLGVTTLQPPAQPRESAGLTPAFVMRTVTRLVPRTAFRSLRS